MTNRFLISVAAAALIAGTGLANAQGTGMSREAPAAGSTVQQNAPSAERGAPSAAPMNRDAGESKSMKGAQSGEKMPPEGSKSQRAQDDVKPGMKGEKSAQDNMKGDKSKSMSSETQDKGAAGKDMKADSKSATESKSQTTGNAATSATAAPPPEKRTQIISAIKSENVPEVTSVNFNISIGTAVPATVRAYPLPPRIVEIYPEWRGYEVIRVRGQWVIVRPQTRTIVYIIEG